MSRASQGSQAPQGLKRKSELDHQAGKDKDRYKKLTLVSSSASSAALFANPFSFSPKKLADLPQSPPPADDQVADGKVSILADYISQQQSLIMLIMTGLEGLIEDLDKARVSKDHKFRLTIIAAIDFYRNGTPSVIMRGYERNNGPQCLGFLVHLLSMVEADSVLGKIAKLKGSLIELLQVALKNLGSQPSVLIPQLEWMEAELAKFAVFKAEVGKLDKQRQKALQENDELIVENSLLKKQLLEKAAPSALAAKDQVEKLVTDKLAAEGSVAGSQVSKSRTHQPPPPPKKPEDNFKSTLDFFSRPRTLMLTILSGAIAGQDIPTKIKMKLDKLDPQFAPMLLSLGEFTKLYGKTTNQVREGAKKTLTKMIIGLALEKKDCHPVDVIAQLDGLALVGSTVASPALKSFYGDISNVFKQSKLEWTEEDPLPSVEDSALTKQNVGLHLNKYMALHRLSKGGSFLIDNDDLQSCFKKRETSLRALLKTQLTHPAPAAQPVR